MHNIGSDSDSFDIFSDQQEITKIEKNALPTQKVDESNLDEIYRESVSDSFDLDVKPMDHRISKKISPQTDYLSSQGLENTIKVINDHEKKGTDPNRLVNELASLKREIDKCDKKMEGQTLSLTKVAYFVSKYFGLGGIGYASLLYARTLNRLPAEQKNNVVALSVSYENGPMNLSVKNLILPEGKGVYTGRVENGVPFGKGEVKNLILPEGKGVYTGHVENGVPHGEGDVTNFVMLEGELYSGPLLDGKPQGKGVIFTSTHVYETVFNNDVLKSSKAYQYIENLELDDGTYTGFTHNGKPEKQGTLWKTNTEIHIGEFLNGKLREGVIFKDDTMISTVADQEKSVSQKVIGQFRLGTFNFLGELTGEGEIIKQDGTIERGNFHGGKLNGYGERETKTEGGKIVTQKGMFEQGVFKYEIRYIEGVRYLATDGATFDEKNRMNGLGKMQILEKDGSVSMYEGNFAYGLLNGKITCTINGKPIYRYYKAGKIEKQNDEI